MKHHCLRFVSAPALACALAGNLSAAPVPTDEGVPLNIDVRASVDAKWEGFRKLATTAHGRLYLLAAVSEVPSAEKMLRPVDRAALATQLRHELAAHGFREITAEETPEVVLTVTYGRGFLRNPYLDDARVDEVTSGIPTATITSAKQAMRQREFDYAGRIQKAQQEKLYVAVTAWQYPPVKGQKPNLFWRTLMIVDNPDHRDLNLAIPAMLAAGVQYFDQSIKDAEVTIRSTVPAGAVKLGPLEVIETGVPAR